MVMWLAWVIWGEFFLISHLEEALCGWGCIDFTQLPSSTVCCGVVQNQCIPNYIVPSTWWGYQLTKTVQNGGQHAIFKILHIEYRTVCCIETYLIHMYHMSKSSKCNWNRFIEGFCMWNVLFHINGLSPNIACVILMSWPLVAIYFLLSNFWLLSVQFSYHI